MTPETRTSACGWAGCGRVRWFVGRHMPGAVGPVLSRRACLYATPADRDFYLDSVPGHPKVLVALGAAHGFKFSSLFGRVLADLATVGSSDVDLEPFRFDRPILGMDDPPTSWMI